MHTFKIYKSIDKECENNWLKLESDSNNNFFQSFHFINEIIKVDGISSLRIIVLFYNKDPVAVLPIYLKKYLLFEILEWIGTKYSDYSSPIISKNFYNFFDKHSFNKIWLEVLREIGNFDLIFFNNQLGQENELNNPLTLFSNTKKFSFIYKIKLPNKYDLYLNNLKNTKKREYYEVHRVNRKIKNLEEKNNVVFKVDKINSNNFNIYEFFKKKTDQLNINKKKHNINSKFIQIYKNLINKNIYNFFRMYILVNDESIAECFCIIYKKIYYYFIPVLISRKYDYFKPGKILILKIINWLISQKMDCFDFGLGNERYKKNFSNQNSFLYRYMFHNGFKGFILKCFLNIVFRLKQI